VSIDVKKLKDETLVDLIEAVYGRVEVSKSEVDVFGGSKREEFCLIGPKRPLTPVRTSFRSCIEYLAKQILEKF
jgi:hypothetical protein